MSEKKDAKTEKISLKNLGLEGFAKWIHRFVMFVTYPFRHFYVFLILVLVIISICVAVPLLNGVSVREIPTWYAQKLKIEQPLKIINIKAISEKVKAKKFKKEVKLKRADYEPKAAPAEKEVQVKEEKPEKYKVWNIKNKDISQKGEIKVAESTVKDLPAEVEEFPVEIQEETVVEIKEPDLPQPEPTPVVEEELVVQEVIPELKYEKREDLDLTYYQTPKHVAGEAIIYGANELYVDDIYLYLYGIYTNPNIHDEALARKYLRELVSGKTVECYIVAETQDGIGTALCFADGKNINQSMIDAYMADNVAL